MEDSDVGHEEQKVVYCEQKGRLLNVVGQRLYYEQYRSHLDVDQRNYTITDFQFRLI